MALRLKNEFKAVTFDNKGMSCNICQTKFSFFIKEVGCPSCNFSHCNKCLKYKCDIPDIGTRKVCGRCYNNINKMKKSIPETVMTDAIISNVNNEQLAPVDITMKLDLLENPAKPPIVMYKHTNHWDKFKKGLEPADQQIVDRLRKLKDEERSISLPTVEEIKQRLALLKDQEASGSNIINIHKLDIRTNQEKTDDLIQEYLAQLELPSVSDPFKEIQERLNSLRNEDDKPCSDQDKKEEIDDIYKKQLFEMINKKLINKVSAMEIESSINVENETEDDDDDDDDDDDEEEDKDKDKDEEEEENECVMCSRTTNEMNLYRCTGCTGDLYCPTCFESSHDEAELDKHKAVHFVKQDKLSSRK